MFKACVPIYGIFVFSVNALFSHLIHAWKALPRPLSSSLLPTWTLGLVFCFSSSGSPFHLIYLPVLCSLLVLVHFLRHLSQCIIFSTGQSLLLYRYCLEAEIISRLHPSEPGTQQVLSKHLLKEQLKYYVIYRENRVDVAGMMDFNSAQGKHFSLNSNNGMAKQFSWWQYVVMVKRLYSGV